MSDLLNSLKSNKANNGSSKSSYSLKEVVGILHLRSIGKSKAEIVQLTGRSAHSLQYKFYEGNVQMAQKDGTIKTVCRSVLKYASMTELFADHGAEWSQDKQDELIEAFLTDLANREQKVS